VQPRLVGVRPDIAAEDAYSPRRSVGARAVPWAALQGTLGVAGVVATTALAKKRRARPGQARVARRDAMVERTRSTETKAVAEPAIPARSSQSYALIPLRNSSSLRTPMSMLDDASRMDPYKVLGIPFLSGRTKIRRAYAGLCKIEHPDKNGGRISLEWQMGEWAYRMLNDPQARATYDTARVVRNGLSLTEGIFKFGFSVLTNFASFVDDATKVISKEVTKSFDRIVEGMGTKQLPEKAGMQ